MADDRRSLRADLEEVIWRSTYTTPIPGPEPESDRYWLNATTDAVLDVLKEHDVNAEANPDAIEYAKACECIFCERFLRSKGVHV